MKFLLNLDCPAACPRDAANLPDFATQVQQLMRDQSQRGEYAKTNQSLRSNEDFDAYVEEFCEFFCLRFADRSLAVKNLGGNPLRSKNLSKILLL